MKWAVGLLVLAAVVAARGARQDFKPQAEGRALHRSLVPSEQRVDAHSMDLEKKIGSPNKQRWVPGVTAAMGAMLGGAASTFLPDDAPQRAGSNNKFTVGTVAGAAVGLGVGVASQVVGGLSLGGSKEESHADDIVPCVEQKSPGELGTLRSAAFLPNHADFDVNDFQWGEVTYAETKENLADLGFGTPRSEVVYTWVPPNPKEDFFGAFAYCIKLRKPTTTITVTELERVEECSRNGTMSLERCFSGAEDEASTPEGKKAKLKGKLRCESVLFALMLPDGGEGLRVDKFETSVEKKLAKGTTSRTTFSKARTGVPQHTLWGWNFDVCKKGGGFLYSLDHCESNALRCVLKAKLTNWGAGCAPTLPRASGEAGYVGSLSAHARAPKAFGEWKESKDTLWAPLRPKFQHIAVAQFVKHFGFDKRVEHIKEVLSRGEELDTQVTHTWVPPTGGRQTGMFVFRIAGMDAAPDGGEDDREKDADDVDVTVPLDLFVELKYDKRPGLQLEPFRFLEDEETSLYSLAVTQRPFEETGQRVGTEYGWNPTLCDGHGAFVYDPQPLCSPVYRCIYDMVLDDPSGGLQEKLKMAIILAVEDADGGDLQATNKIKFFPQATEEERFLNKRSAIVLERALARVDILPVANDRTFYEQLLETEVYPRNNNFCDFLDVATTSLELCARTVFNGDRVALYHVLNKYAPTLGRTSMAGDMRLTQQEFSRVVGATLSPDALANIYMRMWPSTLPQARAQLYAKAVWQRLLKGKLHDAGEVTSQEVFHLLDDDGEGGDNAVDVTDLRKMFPNLDKELGADFDDAHSAEAAGKFMSFADIGDNARVTFVVDYSEASATMHRLPLEVVHTEAMKRVNDDASFAQVVKKHTSALFSFLNGAIPPETVRGQVLLVVKQTGPLAVKLDGKKKLEYEHNMQTVLNELECGEVRFELLAPATEGRMEALGVFGKDLGAVLEFDRLHTDETKLVVLSVHEQKSLAYAKRDADADSVVVHTTPFGWLSADDLDPSVPPPAEFIAGFKALLGPGEPRDDADLFDARDVLVLVGPVAGMCADVASFGKRHSQETTINALVDSKELVEFGQFKEAIEADPSVPPIFRVLLAALTDLWSPKVLVAPSLVVGWQLGFEGQ